MLKLFLIRHGKAVKYTDEDTDFTRHLNKQGTAQINQIGFVLKNQKKQIDQIIASNARRTFETAEIINHYLGLSTILYDKNLYLADRKLILATIIKNQKSNSILYVGHNNGISDLASYLTEKDVLLTTGELVEIHFDFNDWNEISEGNGELKDRIIPSIYSF